MSMIRVETDGPIAHVWLDRPERGNALDREAVVDLRTALDGIAETVELIVVRGAGGRAFCGGADSREMVALPAADRSAALEQFYDLSLDLWNHPALTVAVVDGYASGGGAHVAMACDLRVMAPAAWIQFPSSRYGLNITVVWITLLAGSATATHLLSSARRVPADTALALGLVQAIAPGDEWASALELNEVAGLRETKAAVRAALPQHVYDALQSERERAIELVGLDRFVTSLSREPSARRSRKD